MDGCTKAFVRPSKLSRHIREVHGNGEKPFACEVEGCGAAFVRRSKLRRHEIDVHTLLAPQAFPALIDGSAAPASGGGAAAPLVGDYLAGAGAGGDDIFALTGGAGPDAAAAAAAALKPFACDVVGCDAAFKSRSGLKSHKAKAHTVV